MRLWLIVSMAAVFAAGGVIGFLVARGGSTRGFPGRGGPGIWPPDDFTNLITRKDVYNDLKLDEPQRSIIDFLLASHRKRVEQIRSDRSGVTEALREGVNAALTPGQRNRFEEIQRDYEEQELVAFVNRDVVNHRCELDLTEEETGRLQLILLETARKRKELWQSGREPRESPRWQAIREERDRKIKEILPPEKFKQYTEWKSRPRHDRGDRDRDRKRFEKAPGTRPDDATGTRPDNPRL